MNEAAYQAILTRLGLDSTLTATPECLDWLAQWRDLAHVTNGIVEEDPRFPLIMTALDHCDVAYLSNDWPSFQEAAACVRQAVRGEETHGQ